MGQFANQISNWLDGTELNATEVVKNAATSMFDEMQTPLQQGGNMPVKTGRLRRSLSVGLNGVQRAIGSRAHVFVIPFMRLGDRLTTYRRNVPYATSQEYGFTLPSGAWFTGRFFTTLAVRGWKGHVARAAALSGVALGIRGV